MTALVKNILDVCLSSIGYDLKLIQQSSPIGQACESGNVVSLVKVLSNKNASVNEAILPCIPVSPLFVACLKSRSNVVDLLLYRYSASLSNPPLPSQSHLDAPNCIHALCATGNLALLRKLLLYCAIDDEIVKASDQVDNGHQLVKEKGVSFEVDPFANSFIHPFVLACLCSNVRIVAALWEFYETWTNVDLSRMSFMGLNVVHLAVISHSESVLQFILSQPKLTTCIDQSVSSVPNSPPLNSSHQKLCKILRRVKQDSETVSTPLTLLKSLEEMGNRENMTGLTLCVRLNWPSGLRLLLQHNASLFYRTWHKSSFPSVLHETAYRGSYECLGVLIEHHKQSQLTAPFGSCFVNDTPLHVAVRENHLHCTLLLLREMPQWAHVHDTRSNIPLHYACLNKNIPIMNALINKTKCAHQIIGNDFYNSI